MSLLVREPFASGKLEYEGLGVDEVWKGSKELALSI